MTIDYNLPLDQFEKEVNKLANPPEPEAQESQVEEQEIQEQENVQNDEQTSEEQEEEPIIEEEPEKPQDYRIPKSRLDEESAKRYAAEEQLRHQNTLIEKLLSQLNEKSQKSQPEPEPELDVLDEQAHKYYTSEQKKLKQEIEQLKQMTEQARFENAIATATNQFKQKTPEYENVVEQYMQLKTDEALAMFGDNNQAAQFVEKQLEHLSKNALSNGKNPAEILYNLARKTVNPVAPKKTTTAVKPNLEALNSNMKKSVTAPSNNAANTLPSLPRNLKDLGADYFLDDKKFNQLLDIARNSR